MKRIYFLFVFLVALGLGAAMSAAQEATEKSTDEAQPMGIVTSLRLNARELPNAVSPVVQTLLQGESYPVIGRTANSSWWQIQLDDETTGWVFGATFDVVGGEDVPVTFGVSDPLTGTEIAQLQSNVIPTDAPTATLAPTNTSSPTETPAPTATPTLEPSPTPTEVEPTATPTPEELFVTATATPTLEPSPTAAPSESAARVLAPSLNVRSGPGTENPVVTAVTEGGVYPIIGRTDDYAWWEIQIDELELTGWVFAKFVEVQVSGDVPVTGTAGMPADASYTPVAPGVEVEVTAAPTAAEGTPLPTFVAPTREVFIRVEVLIRAEPSSIGSPLGTIPGGNTATALGRSGDSAWINIRYAGITGWITRQALLPDADVSSLPVTG